MLTSCSPKISSNFTKRYPALKETDSIKVYTPDQYHSRDNSKDEVLGSIIVRDGGFTTNCGYDRMLQIVKDTARKNGGDIIGLNIHLEPSLLGSSCHQFNADILKSNTFTKDSSAVRQDAMKNHFKAATKDTLKHKFLLKFVAGAAFKIGEKDTSSEFTKAVADVLDHGTQITLNGLYKYNKYNGFGLKYSYANYGGSVENVTLSFNNNRPNEFGVYDIQTDIHYFGLTLFTSYPIVDLKNIISWDFSLGYFSYKETSGINTALTAETGSLGLDFNLGYQKNVSERLELGVNMGLFLGFVSDYTFSDGIVTEKISLDDENRISISNFNIGAILSYKL